MHAVSLVEHVVRMNCIRSTRKLLRVLALEGALVTIDAMGCQKEIARTILGRKADYLLAVKGNQERLHDDIRAYAVAAVVGIALFAPAALAHHRLAGHELALPLQPDGDGEDRRHAERRLQPASPDRRGCHWPGAVPHMV